MVKGKMMYWKNKLCSTDINREVKSCFLCSLDGIIIGFAGRYLIKQIKAKNDGITATILQEIVLIVVFVLAGITGYFVDRGMNQQNKEKVWAGI